MEFTNYLLQEKALPQDGKYILAQYNEESIIVYQAYRPSIGHYAAENQAFGGEFKYSRMSWIKPNFLWMMYRSGWGTKPGQEVTLAITLKRSFFESILINAHPSTNILNQTHEEWKSKLGRTNVRLQWDPDHGPHGNPLKRRAIQLGLRNEFLLPFKGDGLVKIEDISNFVNEQRELVNARHLDQLTVPKESIFPVNRETALNIGMNEQNAH